VGKIYSESGRGMMTSGPHGKMIINLVHALISYSTKVLRIYGSGPVRSGRKLEGNREKERKRKLERGREKRREITKRAPGRLILDH
jgi:hypothetical protein